MSGQVKTSAGQLGANALHPTTTGYPARQATEGEAGPFSPELTRRPQRPGVVLIDGRRLIRDCICRCLEVATRMPVRAYVNVDAYTSDIGSHVDLGVIVLGLADTTKLEDGLSALASADPRKANGEPVPVVVMCDVDEPERVMQAMAAGAQGFIPTTTDLNVAVEAIRLVRAGGAFIPACVLTAAHAKAASKAATPAETEEATDEMVVPASSMFTARQSAVVEALRRGKANKTIAYELNMQESTVKVHVRNIMKKLNAKNRTEVAYLTRKLRSDL